MMKIGIDFGTSYTKITYPDKTGFRLFRYPGETGRDYIPTAIAYQNRGEKIWLGENAALKSAHANVDFYNNFKMRLPMLSPAEWNQEGWASGRSPYEVTRDYFQNLLFDEKMSFQNYVGKIERAVVSVPELWYQDIKATGPGTLLKVFNNIGIKIGRLQSEPVCAAAYYAYQVSKEKSLSSFTLLICDVGGGTFDVALCKVNSKEIQVLDHDGSGQKGLQAAGVAFDRNCVISAYSALKGRQPDIVSHEFIDLLNLFEREKIADSGEMFDLLSNPSANLSDTPLYEIVSRGDIYSVTLQQADESFTPIKHDIEEVLQNILLRCENRNIEIDFVLVVGGFGQYPLVQKTIRNKLGLVDNDSRWVVIDQPSRVYAISYGAFLLAQEKVTAFVPYPHTLGIRAKQMISGRWVDLNIPVISAGSMQPGMLQPEFATENDKLLSIEVDRWTRSGNLPVYAQPADSPDLFTIANISSIDYPREGKYYVGFQIDQSNLVSMVLQNINDMSEKRYDLGKMDLVRIQET